MDVTLCHPCHSTGGLQVSLSGGLQARFLLTACRDSSWPSVVFPFGILPYRLTAAATPLRTVFRFLGVLWPLLLCDSRSLSLYLETSEYFFLFALGNILLNVQVSIWTQLLSNTTQGLLQSPRMQWGTGTVCLAIRCSMWLSCLRQRLLDCSFSYLYS